MKKIVMFIVLLFCLFVSTKTTFYNNFEHRDEVDKVVCIRNYRIEDEKVDVTLVHAKDSVSFCKLMSELGLPYPENDYRIGALMCVRNNNDPRQEQPSVNGTVSLKGACLIGASESEHTIYVFHNLQNKDRLGKIISYILEKHVNHLPF